MIKLLTPHEAVWHAKRLLDAANFLRVSRHKRETFYFGKRGWPFKIRVSAHRDPCRNDDVMHDIVLDYMTTEADVRYQVRKAIESFALKVDDCLRRQRRAS